MVTQKRVIENLEKSEFYSEHTASRKWCITPPNLTPHQKVNLLVSMSCVVLLVLSVIVLVYVSEGIPSVGNVCHNISESRRTGIQLDVAPDPIYYNLCGLEKCEFNITSCPNDCPLGYTTDASNCPVSCSCGNDGYFQGDITYSSEDVDKLIEMISTDAKPVTALNLLNGKDVFFQISTWGYGDRAIIPIAIDEAFDFQTAENIRAIIEAIATVTCLQIVKYTDQPDFIKIYNSQICSSRVGRQSGENIILLSPECVGLAGVQHLFMHALGFYHEQSRPDRDDHIEIKWENIVPHKSHNFYKINDVFWMNQGLPYNGMSLMHFPAMAFSKSESKVTLEGKNGTKIRGENPEDLFLGMQENDLFRINALYRCPGYEEHFDRAQWSQWTSWVSSYDIAPLCARMRSCIRTEENGKKSSGICLNQQATLAKYEVATSDTCDQSLNFTAAAADYEIDFGIEEKRFRTVETVRGRRQAGPGTTNPRLLSSRLCNNGKLRAGYFNADGYSDLICIHGDGFMRLYGGSKTELYERLDWEGQTGFCKYDDKAEIIVADLNGDGLHDLLCHRSSGVIEVVMLRNGIFPAQLDWSGSMAGCYGTDKKVYVTDVNGDGKGDLLCGDKDQFQLSSVFLNEFVPLPAA